MANLEIAAQTCQAQLKKTPSSSNNNPNTEDSRRDEWSTEAINNLLDVYEAKWNHRNRGNLKGGDWEDVAVRVSARGGGGKSAKSPFQCKNKVASMKQKYRSETLLQGLNGSNSSRWPFFGRMDVMLRVRSPSTNGNPYPAPPPLFLGSSAAISEQETGGVEHGLHGVRGICGYGHPVKPESQSNENRQHPHPKNLTHNVHGVDHNDRDENVEGDGEDDDASNTLPKQVQPLAEAESEDNTSTPRSKSAHLGGGCGGVSKPDIKKKKYLSKEVAASIRSFTDSILKLERAKMEMFKDSERIRAEMEARRVDMELKRTEIIMNTQLEIAKLLSGKGKQKKFKKSLEKLGACDAAGNGGASGGATSTSTAIGLANSECPVNPPPRTSPSRNGGGVSGSVAALSFADYGSNGSHNHSHSHNQLQLHNGGDVGQHSSMAAASVPVPVASAIQVSSSHGGHPPPPQCHYVPIAIPVSSVAQPIPALQFMGSPTSQPKPD